MVAHDAKPLHGPSSYACIPMIDVEYRRRSQRAARTNKVVTTDEGAKEGQKGWLYLALETLGTSVGLVT
jgi:hypothetical protein